MRVQHRARSEESDTRWRRRCSTGCVGAAVNCPSERPLYPSLALCVDHLVGVENPIYAAVLVVLGQFFAKYKFCMPEEGMEKFQPFLCFLGPKNSLYFQEI